MKCSIRLQSVTTRDTTYSDVLPITFLYMVDYSGAFLNPSLLTSSLERCYSRRYGFASHSMAVTNLNDQRPDPSPTDDVAGVANGAGHENSNQWATALWFRSHLKNHGRVDCDVQGGWINHQKCFGKGHQVQGHDLRPTQIGWTDRNLDRETFGGHHHHQNPPPGRDQVEDDVLVVVPGHADRQDKFRWISAME